MPKIQPRPPSADDRHDLQRILDEELYDRDARWPASASPRPQGAAPSRTRMGREPRA